MKIITILSIFLILSGCRTNSPDEVLEENAAPPVSHISIATMPSLDSLAIFVAQEKGFFDEVGLRVSIERFSAARDRDAAFQSDSSIDGLIFDALALAIYNNAGFGVKAVSNTIGLASIIGAEGIYTIEDLYGETVLLSFNTSMDYILHSALTQAGLSATDVVQEAVPSIPTRLEMLLNGQAGAATMPEPFSTMAQEEGLNFITNTRLLDINPFLLGFRNEVLEDRMADVELFMLALNNAVEFLNTADREEFIDIFIDIVGYPEHTRDTLVLPTFLPFVAPELRHIEDVFEFARSRGLLEVELSAKDLIVDATGN